jgi:NAD(P)-dependent dehydrogenase (short-subunit alcohol dehydrogenase family)
MSKVWFVTGSSRGLGRRFVEAALGRGDRVVATARSIESLGDLVATYGDAVLPLEMDVTDKAAVFETVKRAAEHFGRLDVVVNCAAIDHTLSVDEMTIEQWDQVINVNLRGPFLLAKAALPMMRQQRSGHIFNIASTAATRAWANAAAYHASKWGLVGFSRGLGVEGRADGIRVTTIIPGGMRTHFFDRFAEQGIPMPDEQNLQDPANVAQVIVFAAQVPPESALQEVIITPVTETSWP